MNTDKKPLVLIADDEPVNIQVLVEILQHDYRIKVATNGRVALDLANKDEKPDLIILDIEMPELDGFEVCRNLKANSETKQIPVMFVTSLDNASAEFEGLQLEAMEFIGKPVNPSTLRMRVRNLVRLKLMHDQLIHLSTHDAMTGIANRRRFNEVLDLEWRRAMRSGDSIGLMMFDVDYFKQFNDHYGHIEGDSCLINVAKALASFTHRAGDLTARYGGEEFAVILTKAELADAAAIAEKIRISIESLQLPHALSPIGRVAVSCGVAVMIPSETNALGDLIDRADQRLYRAKESGRNRVEA